MGDIYVNFYGGSPLNRLAWLRTSQPFLNAIVRAPTTRWLLFKEGQPLVQSTSSAPKPSLARLTTSDVESLLGPEPYFAQAQREGELAPSDVPVLEAARLHGTPIVFLGLHETSTDHADALPSSDFSAKTSAEVVLANIKGTPYFSLDVSDVAQSALDETLQNAAVAKEGGKLMFSEPRAAAGGFDAFEAAVFAAGRTMTDWNARNKFCPSCGSPVHSLWAGWKLSCSSLLPWADNAGKKPCPTAHGLHNFMHPRTDGVVIMAVVDESGDKILLGRNACVPLRPRTAPSLTVSPSCSQKKWPAKFYSCLAGFVEPGESFEDAVRRELWEEAGVKVWNVRYHSTQPWPFPANLMGGFYAQASASQPLRTDLDNELEEARWYTREEVLAVLRNSGGTILTRKDHRELFTASEDLKPVETSGANPLAGDAVKAGESAAVDAAAAAERAPPSTLAPSFKMPPTSAIAGVLISEWAHGRAGFQPESPKL
ncbi:NUDIX hydrolase domain-like protein [Lenzites betulinus]|nr:NUDIX hydrolase domain-like protein [Lenzites betulinus]